MNKKKEAFSAKLAQVDEDHSSGPHAADLPREHRHGSQAVPAMRAMRRAEPAPEHPERGLKETTGTASALLARAEERSNALLFLPPGAMDLYSAMK